MKKVTIISFLFFFSYLVFGQNVGKPRPGGERTPGIGFGFSDTIVTALPVPLNEIFIRANEWAQENFDIEEKSPEVKVALSDPIAKMIICNGQRDIIIRRRTNGDTITIIMQYQLIMRLSHSKCEADIKNIRFGFWEEDKFRYIAAERIMFNRKLLEKRPRLIRFRERLAAEVKDIAGSVFSSLEIHLNKNPDL